MEIAEIGGTANGGCNRQALTQEDQKGRELFMRWCQEAGCSLRVDQMGNIFARREGKNPDAPAVITGSHLDTQPTGGKFDGVYGVLAGLEVIRSLNDHNIETESPVEVVVWTNEEGARFSPAMIGSGVWSGEFSLDYGWSRKDKSGVSIKEALEDTGFLGDVHCQPHDIQAAFELHIEQGPILEQEQKTIGVVEGVQGMRWYDLTLMGQPVHAGPTPMEDRFDPFMALGEITQALYLLAKEHAPWSRVTFGDISVEPGARNTVPEKLVLAVDLRHPDQGVLDEMDRQFREIVNRICTFYQLQSAIDDEWNSPAVKFNPDCIGAVQTAVDDLGYSHLRMFSGAGHDSVYVSRRVPASMIFIPCEKGISHNEAENAAVEDIGAGADVLLNAMLTAATKFS